MSATIRHQHTNNNIPSHIPFRRLNGRNYIRFDYCQERFDNYITIGGVKYYEANKIRKPRAKKLAPIIIR
jgi:hypothetical protein